MKKTVRIKASSLPTRSPLLAALVCWLMLDRLGAPEWAYGVMWTIFAVLATVVLIERFTSTERDVPGFGEK
ncbi:MAG TPA: hypothetical protein VGC21_12740 [Telluria sp.]|jgi:hypothetical protein